MSEIIAFDGLSENKVRNVGGSFQGDKTAFLLEGSN